MAKNHETMPSDVLNSIQLRDEFASALSELYKKEVPLYSDLLQLVSKINDEILENDEVLRKQLKESNSLSRLNLERHGAIRLASAEEMVELTRFLRVLDMHPVGYYDLSTPPASLPIHATCFRPLSIESLNISPFRLFVSLLRSDLLPADPNIREIFQSSTGKHQLFSDRVTELIVHAEQRGGSLPRTLASEFISEALPSFKFHKTSELTTASYSILANCSPLLADILAFPNPHINHLTPRTLDISAVQLALLANPKFQAKKSGIEGPPSSLVCPILLRQTSFNAVAETVSFSDGKTGLHTARFGEIEQRGAAVTPFGRHVYDRLLVQSPSRCAFEEELVRAVPTSWEKLRRAGWIWVRYHLLKPVPETEIVTAVEVASVNEAVELLLERKLITFSPITYEDFLPASAAGIFASNLNIESTPQVLRTLADEYGGQKQSVSHMYQVVSSPKKQLEAILARVPGVWLRDEMEIYRDIQEASMWECVHFFNSKIKVTAN
jgi:uncharacterized glyoxalase superfamily metalloenzyme YdcJ